MPVTENNPEPGPTELNLWWLLDSLRRHWLLIIVCGVLGTLIAFALSSLPAKQYTAETDLTVLRTGIQLTLDPTIRTVSDSDPSQQSLDDLLRRKSLVALGTSTDFAQRVLQQIGPSLPEASRSAADLLGQVDVRQDGDILRVTARDSAPETALLISQTWANLLQDRINAVIGNAGPDTATLTKQAQDAQKEYDTRQSAFENFLRTSPQTALQNQIDLLNNQVFGNVQVKTKMLFLQQDAQALRGRIANGADPVARGDQLALILLEANAFNNAGASTNTTTVSSSPSTFSTQLNVSLDTAPLNKADALGQLDAMLAAVQTRLDAISPAAEQAMQTQLNTLQAQFERSAAQQKELGSARDLALSTLLSLNTKVAESAVTTGPGNQVVTMLNPATLPTKPLSSPRLLNTLIGAMVGLILGIILAVLWDLLFQVGAQSTNKGLLSGLRARFQ